jgi:hypothetical protein
MKRLSVVQENIAAIPDVKHTTLTEDQITMLYVRLLITSIESRDPSVVTDAQSGQSIEDTLEWITEVLTILRLVKEKE